MASALSARLNTALPATSTLAPAALTRGEVSGSIPPSTSSSQAGFCSSINPRIVAIFGSMSCMKCCPPKPGSTVITRIRSTRGRIYERKERQHGLGRRIRLDRHTGFLSQFACDPDRFQDLLFAVRLNMKVDKIRARTAKGFGIADRFTDHKMDVDWHTGCLTKRFQHWNTDRDIRDEASVHNIEMNIVSSTEPDILHLGAKSGKVSGKNGRRDFYHFLHPVMLFVSRFCCRIMVFHE